MIVTEEQLQHQRILGMLLCACGHRTKSAQQGPPRRSAAVARATEQNSRCPCLNSHHLDCTEKIPVLPQKQLTATTSRDCNHFVYPVPRAKPLCCNAAASSKRERRPRPLEEEAQAFSSMRQDQAPKSSVQDVAAAVQNTPITTRPEHSLVCRCPLAPSQAAGCCDYLPRKKCFITALTKEKGICLNA